MIHICVHNSPFYNDCSIIVAVERSDNSFQFCITVHREGQYYFEIFDSRFPKSKLICTIAAITLAILALFNCCLFYLKADTFF